jgi:hypothetical protein
LIKIVVCDEGIDVGEDDETKEHGEEELVEM